MLITKDRKRIEAKELFPNIKSFKEELKLSYNNLNFENINIQNLILDVYNKILNDDDIVQYCRLQQGKHYPTFFNFKYKNRNQLEFWLERGFDENYFNNLTKQITENRTKKSIVTYDKLKEEKKIIEEGYTINYKYKNLEFISENIPICNNCNSELNMSKFISDKLGNSIEIFGCKNKNCDTNIIKGNKKLLWYSFLPEYKYNEVLNNIKKDTIFTKKYWINKGLTEEESVIKISEIQTINSKLSLLSENHKNKGKFKENLRKKGYTEEEIEECCLTPANIKFWQNKGFSKKKSKRKVFKNQSYAAKFVDFDKRLIPSNKEYWTNKGFSEEESIQKVKERQTTFSKEICIEKYGEENGIQRWKERQIKWLLNYKKSNYSQVSQKLFQEIYLRLPKNLDIYFATLNKNKEIEIDTNKNYEYRLELDKSYILPDFFIKDKKIILEFDGTYFHRNTPENDKREQERNKNIINSGYKVYHISEYDYKQDKELVIQKCIEFINKN